MDSLVRPLDHPGIPKVVAWGRSQYFEYLVMERLGANLEDAIKKIGATQLTQRNLVVLICQMVRRCLLVVHKPEQSSHRYRDRPQLDILEHVHAKGIVHCDVKPRNFVFGTGENAGRLHLIDFGLSRPWRDPTTGKPLPEDPNWGFRGTPQFASRHVHSRHSMYSASRVSN